ncbi:PH domain-containing protein [Streptomyces spiramyceticus]|uniref:PH domain-containing protein n=1 Tax=Streptomyces spiramyceticus TaxID=299717 RepID=UPI003B75BD2E
MFRAARLAIVATPDHLVVRNIFRTHTVPWGEIASIAPPKSYGATRKGGIIVSRIDGSSLSATAYVRGPHNRDSFAVSVANNLQQMAARAAQR